MVEVKLEALDLNNAGKDTYVTLRVGEVQKLSKVKAEAKYNFSEVVRGDRKFGVVDVFKKIGSQTIPIRQDPDVPHHEMEVALPNDAKMPFRVTLSDAKPVDAAAKDSNEHIVDAKSYLAEHNLELKLSNAMKEVLRERPSNPAEFIAAMLRGEQGSYTKVPDDAGAGDAKPAEAPAEEEKLYETPAESTPETPAA